MLLKNEVSASLRIAHYTSVCCSKYQYMKVKHACTCIFKHLCICIWETISEVGFPIVIVAYGVPWNIFGKPEMGLKLQRISWDTFSLYDAKVTSDVWNNDQIIWLLSCTYLWLAFPYTLSSWHQPIICLAILVSRSAVDIRLDPESKHPNLEVSEDGRSTTCTISPSEEASTSGSLIVVGTEGFKVGRHYWEVRVDDKPNWEVGVLTEDTRSKLKRGRLHTLQGEQFWSLKRSNGKYYPAKVHGEIKKYICFQVPVVGIYLDMGKGIVSFYDTLDMKAIMKLRVKTSKKLYPFFSPGLSIVCF